MPRPKRTIPAKSRNVRIPEDLDAQVQLLLMNPRTGSVKYGKWSQLIEALLRRWVAEQRQSLTNPENPQ
jgi:hypothetical protein